MYHKNWGSFQKGCTGRQLCPSIFVFLCCYNCTSEAFTQAERLTCENWFHLSSSHHLSSAPMIGFTLLPYALSLFFYSMTPFRLHLSPSLPLALTLSPPPPYSVSPYTSWLGTIASRAALQFCLFLRGCSAAHISLSLSSLIFLFLLFFNHFISFILVGTVIGACVRNRPEQADILLWNIIAASWLLLCVCLSVCVDSAALMFICQNSFCC